MTWRDSSGPLAAFVFFTTVRITTQTPDGQGRIEEGVATGFFYTIPRPSGETRTFVVTNRHVVEGASRIELHMLQDRNGEPVPGSDTGIVYTDPREGNAWHGHPDPAVDVAVMSQSEALHFVIDQEKAGEDVPRPHVSTIDARINVVTPEAMRQVNPLEEIVVVGYPGGHYDRANLTPLARRGVIATLPAQDYEGLPVFVIDAPIFPGSSGSPVYQLFPGSPERLGLLGILASGETTEELTESGDAYQPLINLGLVFKAWTINECIDNALKVLGHAPLVL